MNWKKIIEDNIYWLNKCIELNKYIPKEEALKPIEMTKEQLLEKAKKDYPIGTVYGCVRFGYDKNKEGYKGISTVEKTDEIKYFTYTSNGNFGDEIDIYSKGFIYSKGKWAEIISKPEEVETTKVDTFVLPEKWWMKVTDRNLPEINKARSLYGTYKNELSPRYIFVVNDANYKIRGATKEDDISEYGEELTNDQFKKYVLKEDIEIKPEVVDNSVYTLKQIEAALYKFDKEDIKDILDAIKKHK